MKKRTLATVSDEIEAIQVTTKEHTKAIEKLDEAKKLLESELEKLADEQGLSTGGGAASTFKIEPRTVPQSANWDDFYAYVHENKYYHLLQKRFAVTAVRELWELGKVVPGVSKFTSNKVTVKGN